MNDWEVKVAKLKTEYGQHLNDKMKVAVLYGMMQKELQEKIADSCAVSWDSTSDKDAGTMLERLKTQLRNMAQARRDVQ